MARFLVSGGIAVALMGAGVIVPVVADRFVSDQMSALGIGFIAVGVGMIACGATLAVLGFGQGTTGMPSGARAAVAANILVLAFLALDLSDRSVRRDGKLFYWTTFLLPPALLLFVGLVAARPWSWWVARGVAALGALWFLGFLVVIPFAPLQSDGVPAPWYGHLYAAGVTLAFAGVLAGAFRALGRPETRSYFGIGAPEASVAAAPGTV